LAGGWWLEGEPSPTPLPARYIWYATEDNGGGLFTVATSASDFPGDRHAQYGEAARIGLAALKGKIFLGTWSLKEAHTVEVPIVSRRLPTPLIRESILRGLYRLYENGFEGGDFQVDQEGVAIELGVTPALVSTAVEYLFDKGLIEHYGTLGRNWSTGDFWLSTSGVDFVESELTDTGQGETSAPDIKAILFIDIADSTSLTERVGDVTFREKSRVADRMLRANVVD
jgi:hypothetical protein